MIGENKTSKYIKYAIGEIVLVVIGILIALQINNWNEKRKVDDQAAALTEKLKLEMEQTIDYLDFTHDGIEHQIQFIQMVLHANTTNLDSIMDQSRFGLSPIFYMSSYSQFFDPPANIYQTAINDGSIRNIKDKKLLNILQDFHQSVKVRLDQLIQEEYALGREINDYISREYTALFEDDFFSSDNKYDVSLLNQFFMKVREDGTIRYKLAERIEYKKARQRFLGRFKKAFENQLSTHR
jgi:hypothetical protein